MTDIKIVRRIGPHPHADGKGSVSKKGCPDIFELSNGDFAVIGRLHTDDLRASLPPDASCGSDEAIVVVDRHIMVGARRDIPKG